MRISAMHGVLAAAVAGVVVATMSVAQASMVTAVPPPTTDSGDLSTSPSTFFVGDSITILANFADSQKGKTVQFLKETSPGSGGYEPIGEKVANSSGNASLTGYTIGEPQKVFARTSAGKETEVDTLTPKTAPGGDGEINACFDRDDGDLNILLPPKLCTSSQKALSWNSTGPSGGGQAFEKVADTDHAVNGTHEITTKTLPAGNYVVTVRLKAVNESSDDRIISCDFASDGTKDGIGVKVPGNGTETIVLLDAFESSGGTVTVSCTSTSALLVRDVTLIAMKVDSIG